MAKKLIYSLFLSSFFMISSPVLQAWEFCGFNCDCECNSPCDSMDVAVELRVAYYSPSSKIVRKIYGNGWADYQLEISKGIGCGWRVWAGVSGFSEDGNSIGFEDKTKMSLVPINLGLKYDYKLCNNFTIFVGGAACYSFLNIHDSSDYVHQHIHKGAWGGLVQTGLKYQFYGCGYVSVFADYFFQEFSFHNTHEPAYYGDSYYYESCNVERHNLNMNGYKVGVGLGFTF